MQLGTLSKLEPIRDRFVGFCDGCVLQTPLCGVRQDPEVLEDGRVELRRMPERDNTRAWRALLDAGPDAVVAVLTSRAPDVRGLKADNPLARLGLVAEETRLELVDQATGR